MKSIVISLYGASCSGKSTTALGLTAEMKIRGYHSELVQEYIKKWAWRGMKPLKYDQIYVLGQQAYAEANLYEKVKYIVTDSPILLVPFFEDYLLNKKVTKMAALEFLKDAEANGVLHLNFWLTRPGQFDPRGRYETQEESDLLSKKMRAYFEDLNIKFIDLPTDHHERIKIIMEEVDKLDHVKASKTDSDCDL